ncbi:MAG: malate dehydrogenase [Candidatus Omnitrophica bacterium]|nr:malate dehydrogenase [Candidatus Omnitrophota bacterium]
MQITDKEIHDYHLGGKIGISLNKPLNDQRDLSIAYTPGVSSVCRSIEEHPQKVFDLTARGNLVAVVTDGTAVLGLGNTGASASIPVMEGKCALFKAFAGVDGWPVPLEGVSGPDGRTDPDKLIETVQRIAPMYGGINLEDIASPACFEVEDRLSDLLDIPVFHDDQWGTAIITLAALTNYCHISGKAMSDIKVAINGAGAAGLRIAEMIKADGVRDCVLCDRKGVVHEGRKDLNRVKRDHAVRTDKRTLGDIMRGADVFIGVSAADCVSPRMILSMNEYPAIFAMANPVPEITPEAVAECMADRDYIMATGRSDYPNQVNNVLGFPFIFRGALDVRARGITMGMKIAAAESLAELARKGDVPEKVCRAYGRRFEFGPDYLIPTPFDPRIMASESRAVAEEAIKEGVARISEVPEYEHA